MEPNFDNFETILGKGCFDMLRLVCDIVGYSLNDFETLSGQPFVNVETMLEQFTVHVGIMLGPFGNHCLILAETIFKRSVNHFLE